MRFWQVKIDSAISDSKNWNLYAQKQNIIIQTKGMKKSVSLIHPFYPLKQSELDQLLTRDSTNGFG